MVFFANAARNARRPVHVDCEMIDAAVDVGQRDRLHELEGDLILCRCNGK